MATLQDLSNGTVCLTIWCHLTELCAFCRSMKIWKLIFLLWLPFSLPKHMWCQFGHLQHLALRLMSETVLAMLPFCLFGQSLVANFTYKWHRSRRAWWKLWSFTMFRFILNLSATCSPAASIISAAQLHVATVGRCNAVSPCYFSGLIMEAQPGCSVGDRRHSIVLILSLCFSQIEFVSLSSDRVKLWWFMILNIIPHFIGTQQNSSQNRLSKNYFFWKFTSYFTFR